MTPLGLFNGNSIFQLRNRTNFSNKEDKLQIKNIIYHAAKDALCCLEEALADAK